MTVSEQAPDAKVPKRRDIQQVAQAAMHLIANFNGSWRGILQMRRR
jgi:hypothetical protein